MPGARLGRGAGIRLTMGSTLVEGATGTEEGADALDDGAGGDPTFSEGRSEDDELSS